LEYGPAILVCAEIRLAKIVYTIFKNALALGFWLLAKSNPAENPTLLAADSR
jgi:hypothetical protein